MALNNSKIPWFVEVTWLTQGDRDSAIQRFQELWLAVKPNNREIIGDLTPEEVALASANQRIIFVRGEVQGVMHA